MYRDVDCLGTVSVETLGAAYQAADLFIFPDPGRLPDGEGFGSWKLSLGSVRRTRFDSRRFVVINYAK